MRTFPARSCSPRGRLRGFTLVELMIVMSLLAVVMFLAVPAFQNLLTGTLQREMDRFSGVIRLLRNEAILGRSTFRVMLDVHEGRYLVEQRAEDGAFVTRHDPSSLRPHAFPAAFTLERVLMFGEVVRVREEEPVPIVVDASGFVDPFLLQFTVDDEPYTLKVQGFTGKLKLVEGHVDE